VDGVVIKAHGRSNAAAVAGALRVARNFVLQRGVEGIRAELDSRPFGPEEGDKEE
jgi:glycerol-3-phosphate acyltransferase PlsX